MGSALGELGQVLSGARWPSGPTSGELSPAIVDAPTALLANPPPNIDHRLMRLLECYAERGIDVRERP